MKVSLISVNKRTLRKPGKQLTQNILLLPEKAAEIAERLELKSGKTILNRGVRKAFAQELGQEVRLQNSGLKRLYNIFMGNF